MKPSNSFIDESVMRAEGEPLPYQMFTNNCDGLVVKEITREEWDSAILARNTARCGAGDKYRAPPCSGNAYCFGNALGCTCY